MEHYFQQVALANDLWGIESASSRLVDRWRYKRIDAIMEELVEASGVIVDTILNSGHLVGDRDDGPDSPHQSETEPSSAPPPEEQTSQLDNQTEDQTSSSIDIGKSLPHGSTTAMLLCLSTATYRGDWIPLRFTQRHCFEVDDKWPTGKRAGKRSNTRTRCRVDM